jgi:hypothetical protein
MRARIFNPQWMLATSFIEACFIAYCPFNVSLCYMCRYYKLPGRVEPPCGGFRVRWPVRRFPCGPQSDSHTFLPSAPSSNRTSGFPRYGSPTTFPVGVSAPVVVETPRPAKLGESQSFKYL